MARRCRGYLSCLAFVIFLGSAAPIRAQGLVLPAVGPVNQSMGGASVAAPLDAIGALYWNPATLSGLPQSQMDVGVQLLYTRTKVGSAIAPGAFGPGVPAGPLADDTDSDTGIYPLPTLGLAYRPEESPLTFGLGVFTIGGFGTNYPADLANPVLTPRPPNGFGFEAINSELLILEVAPAVAYRLNDHLSVGGGPTITMARLTADPAVFTSPDDANGDGFATYPTGSHSRFHWGGGFQAGVYCTANCSWAFGASLRSTQWLQTLTYHATDELGRPRNYRVRLDYPMIVSVGASYTGVERLLVALDVRYVDYSNTKGFGPAGFDATGASPTLGWDSVVAVAAGVQYRLTEAIALRAGYTFNENPIPDAVAAFNVAAPALYEHIVYLGGSMQVSAALSLTMAYYHAFNFTNTGPLAGPAGAIPGTSVTNETVIDALTVGFSVKF